VQERNCIRFNTDTNLIPIPYTDFIPISIQKLIPIPRYFGLKIQIQISKSHTVSSLEFRLKDYIIRPLWLIIQYYLQYANHRLAPSMYYLCRLLRAALCNRTNHHHFQSLYNSSIKSRKSNIQNGIRSPTIMITLQDSTVDDVTTRGQSGQGAQANCLIGHTAATINYNPSLDTQHENDK